MAIEENEKTNKMLNNEALCLARSIAILNSEFIYYEKNKLLRLDSLKLNELSSKHEKMTLRINSDFPNARVNLILANYNDNSNHDLTKLDVDLIMNELIESTEKQIKTGIIGED